MLTDMKRYTISVSPEMEQEINQMGNKYFGNKAQSEIIRSLIHLGLESLKTEEKDNPPTK